MSEPIKFPKFEIRMPSDDELRASSLAWFERVGPTLIDRWPADLAALSIPTIFEPYPFGVFEEMYDSRQNEPSLELRSFAARLDEAIGWRRKFIRLNSRSPKDAPWPFEVPATLSGKEVIHILACSERALDDLCRFRWIPEHPAYVCLRDFIPSVRPDREYRCFVKDRKLIAVTHYDYVHPWTGPEDGGRALRERINNWFAEKLQPVLHMETVVFDIHENYDGTFLLIEINPYGLSDPCYFGSYENVENAFSFIEYAPLRSPDGEEIEECEG